MEDSGDICQIDTFTRAALLKKLVSLAQPVKATDLVCQSGINKRKQGRHQPRHRSEALHRAHVGGCGVMQTSNL